MKHVCRVASLRTYPAGQTGWIVCTRCGSRWQTAVPAFGFQGPLRPGEVVFCQNAEPCHCR